MNSGQFFTAVIAGLLDTATLALIGLAIVVTFRATRVLNVAAGQFLVLGSYTFYWLYVTVGLPFGVAVIFALALGAVYGALTHQVVMRPVIGQPLFVPAIVSLGLGAILSGVIDIIWGSNPRSLPLPFASHSYHFPFGGPSAFVTNYQLVSVGVAALLLGGFAVFERRSRFGLQMRASSENALLASVSGIPINTVYLVGWALGGLVSTIIGINYVFSTGVVSTDATSLGLVALAPVVVAGFDNLAGLIVGSAIVGFLEAFVELWIDNLAAQAVTFLVLMLVVLVRPTGLFAPTAATRRAA